MSVDLLQGTWVDAVVGLLLIGSGLLALVSAFGILRLPDFFQRMHPTALCSTFGTWLASFAAIVHFSAAGEGPRLHAWLLMILLSITVPVGMILLGRAALFRARQSTPALVPPSISGRPEAPPEPTSAAAAASSEDPERTRPAALG